MIGMTLAEALSVLSGKKVSVTRCGGLSEGDTELVLRVTEEEGEVRLVTGIFKLRV